MTRFRPQVEELTARLVPSTADAVDPADIGTASAAATYPPPGPGQPPADSSPPAAALPPTTTASATTDVPPVEPEPITSQPPDPGAPNPINALKHEYIRGLLEETHLILEMEQLYESYDLLANGSLEALIERISGATPEIRDAARLRMEDYASQMASISHELLVLYGQYVENYLNIVEDYTLLQDILPNSPFLTDNPVPEVYQIPPRYLELLGQIA